MTDSAERLPGNEALIDDTSFLLARASALSNAAGNAALAELGLKVRSYSVLELAGNEGRTSQREIADFLRLDPSQVVALVDELQRAKLVDREPDPRDRRANVIVATPLGIDLLAKARAKVRTAVQTLHSDLTENERETLAALLRRTAFPSR
jgi:DNA-binding MarR family transcriptional regulator